MDPILFTLRFNSSNSFSPPPNGAGNGPIDTLKLAELALFAGSSSANYADQTPDGFNFSRNGVTITVYGDGFTYAGGIPDGGNVSRMVVKDGDAFAYQFQGWNVGDTIPFSAFLSKNPAAIASILFAGNDLITGSNFADRLYGLNGRDDIAGGEGNDRLYGGNGDDVLSGSAGRDRLYGGSGNDWLVGGKGNDLLYGGSGSDTASFSDKLSPVVVKLVKGKTVKAKIGVKEVDKLKSVENVVGGLGKDKLTGDRGDNRLEGYSGDDVLKGKAGNDVLAGGFGSDTLIGGKGADAFVFNTPPSGRNWFDVDKIKDFTPGVDKIHLDNAIFQQLATGGVSAANFLAAPNAFAGKGGQFLVYNTKSGTLIYDPSGDGSANPQVIWQIAVLKGAPTLTASDFFVYSSLPPGP